MIHRDIANILQQHTQWFPVVHLSGPRQSGKTTLSRSVFPDAPYANLETPSTLALCQSDPRGFLDNLLAKGRPVLIDEAQRYPDIFSWIQVIADEIGEDGLFVLTGSQNFLMNNRVSQSLAGRTSVLTLLPLHIREHGKTDVSLDQLMFRGSYPRLYDERRQPPPPNVLFENYVTTYLERDVRQLTAVQDLATFHRFLQLCAARTGQLVNKANLSVETGISQPSVERWLSVLEASNVVFRLQPFHANISKRLIKTPKLYFCDTGLACYLLGIQGVQMLETHPMRGALFENFVCAELLKESFNVGKRPEIHFFRDKTGHEVDFLVRNEMGDIEALETKSGKTFSSAWLKDLRYVLGLLGGEVSEASLLYNGSEESYTHDIAIRNVVNYLLGRSHY